MTPLAYIALGWHLIPIRPGSKHPLDGQGLSHATLDEDVIEGWCVKECDWAVACAPSGILALDVDPRHGGDTDWRDLLDRLGPLPDHPIQSTRGGGWHHVFRDPGFACVGKLSRGVDVRRRAYILVSPSPGYAWDVAPDGDPPELPQPWKDALAKKRPKVKPRATTREPPPDSAGTKYGLKALEDECAAVAAEPEGNRNNRLNTAALKLAGLVAGGELDGGHTRARLFDSALICGLPEHEVEQTMNSGWHAGLPTPRAAPPRAAPPRSNLALAPRPSIPPPTDEDCPQDMLPYTRVLRGEIPGPDDWRRGLTRRMVGEGENRHEVIEKTAANLVELLTHEEGWEGCLCWNELGYTAQWDNPPPAIPGLVTPSGQVTDNHATWVQQAARRQWGVTWPKVAVLDAIKSAAEQRIVHPVRDWLCSLEWDGVPRILTWLQDYMGARDSVCPVGAWWLVSAVARAMKPGCQADHVLVLQGPQGVGKSTALRILGGEWYSGSLGSLHDKDSEQSLSGVWMMEIAELDALKGKAQTEIKNFISQTAPRLRPSYGYFFMSRPRSCVFAGTTNESEFLGDSTGARRFWPVAVTELRREELIRDREQLMAEAVQLYEDGQRWWPDGREEAAALAAEAEERFIADPWEDVLRPWLEERDVMGDHLGMFEVLKQCGVDKGQITMSESKRGASIMRRLGWKNVHTRGGNRWKKLGV